MMYNKKGDLKRIFLATIMLMVLGVGVWFVLGAHGMSASITPTILKGGQNHSFNVSITNNVGVSIDTVNITRLDTNFSEFSCAAVSGATCGAESNTGVQLTSAALGSGNTEVYTIWVVTANVNNNTKLKVLTIDTGSGENETNVSLQIDNDSPIPGISSVSDGTNTVSTFVYASFLKSGAINVSIAVNDTGYATLDSVIFYYSNATETPTSSNFSVIMNLATGDGNNTDNIYSALINGTTHEDNISFIVYANDTVGNVGWQNGTDNAGFNFSIDGLAPQVSAIVLNDTKGDNDNVVISDELYRINATVNDTYPTGSNTTTVYVNGTSSNSIAMDCAADGVLWLNITNMSDLGFTSDGNYTLTITAIDTVGNINASETITIEIDDTLPNVTNIITNLTRNFTSDSSEIVQINVTVADNIKNVTVYNGTDEYMYNMSNAAGAAYKEGGVFTVTINGTLTDFCPSSGDGIECVLYINATDTLGRENKTETLTITVDSVAPNVTDIAINDTYPTTGDLVVRSDDSIKLNLTATNNVLNVSVNGTLLTSAGGNSYELNTTPSSLGCNTNGSCLLNFTSYDKALNKNDTGVLTIIIDDENPALTYLMTNISDGSGGTTNITTSSISINLSVNVSDGYDIYYVTLNDTINATFTAAANNYSLVNTSAEMGCAHPGSGYEYNCTLGITAYDNATNSISSTIDIIIDDYAPRVGTITTNATDNRVTSTTAEINFTVTITEGYYFNASLNKSTHLGRTNLSGTGAANTYYAVNTTADFGCTGNGNCVIGLSAYDELGNLNDTITVTILVDTTKPNITGVNTNTPVGYTGTLTVSATLQDNLNVNGTRIYIDETSNGYYNFSETGLTTVSMTHDIDLSTACAGSACASGGHTVYVQANDSTGQWSDITVDSYRSFTISDDTNNTQKLNKNWDTLNLGMASQWINISNPVESNISTFLTTIGHLGTNYNLVYYYLDGTWKYFKRGNWTTSNLKYINNTNDQMYWINMSKEVDFYIS
ncbi:MAG: hypothetical protein KAU20_04290 [Nanoarchaeota archaeon]|nr:hypothetical protein [Nanoarchaeota archaeon]